MNRRAHLAVVLVVLLAPSCAKPGTDDDVADESGTEDGGEGSSTTTVSNETGTTGEPDPCEGLVPDLPLFAANAVYNGEISISSCEFLIGVPFAEDQLVEGTDMDAEGSYFTCGCGDEWDCGYICSGPTRVRISYVDEHCVVGTLSEATGGGTETDSGTDSGTDTTDGGGTDTTDTGGLGGGEPACIPTGGFVIRR